MKQLEFRRHQHRDCEKKELKNENLRVYFNIVGDEQRLLTKEEEIELAKRIEKGDDSAKNELIIKNLKLVVYIARCYAAPFPWILFDIIQDGNIGLMQAAKKFNWRRGYRFSTYATWWIRQEIIRNIGNYLYGRKLPPNLINEIQTMKRVKMALFQKLSRTPTDEEIAEKLEISLSRQIKLSSAAKIRQDASLDCPLPDGTSLGELIEDRSASTPEEEVSSRINLEKVRELIENFFSDSERSKDILKSHLFGKDTLEQIGTRWKVTRERTRQIEATGIRRMKKTSFFQELRTFYWR